MNNYKNNISGIIKQMGCGKGSVHTDLTYFGRQRPERLFLRDKKLITK